MQINRVSGASLGTNPISIQTDALGRFYVEYPASSADPLIANVTITAPGLPAPVKLYTATSLPIIWQDAVPTVNRVFGAGVIALGYALCKRSIAVSIAAAARCAVHMDPRQRNRDRSDVALGRLE